MGQWDSRLAAPLSVCSETATDAQDGHPSSISLFIGDLLRSRIDSMAKAYHGLFRRGMRYIISPPRRQGKSPCGTPTNSVECAASHGYGILSERPYYRVRDRGSGRPRR